MTSNFSFQDGSAMLWDLNEGKHLYTLDGGNIINAMCFRLTVTGFVLRLALLSRYGYVLLGANITDRAIQYK
jgi:hypothetical protein